MKKKLLAALLGLCLTAVPFCSALAAGISPDGTAGGDAPLTVGSVFPSVNPMEELPVTGTELDEIPVSSDLPVQTLTPVSPAPTASPEPSAEPAQTASPVQTTAPVQTAAPAQTAAPQPEPTLDPRNAADLVVLGQDLTDAQRQTVLDLLDVPDLSKIAHIAVTHQDEQDLLGALVSADKIGSRAISSARVTKTPAGTGVHVTCHNITYVTEAMYGSALLTAGIESAEVVVAAPVPVSGTAALAGIFKAYEVANNLSLDNVAKAVASQELLLSGELAEFIGSDQAVELIGQLKQMVIENGWDNEQTIRPALVDLLSQLNLTLTDEQIDQVVALALRFCSLDMEPEQIAKQLQGIVQTYQKAMTAGEKVQNFLSKVADVFSGVANWFKGLFHR